MSIAADIREVARYHELIVALAMREVRVRYKHTLLGVAWALLLPLSLMLVFTYVFSRIAPLHTDLPYPVFVYLGLVPWQLHANIITQGARSLSDNSNLVTKVYFAREVLPLSAVLSALADFALACAGGGAADAVVRRGAGGRVWCWCRWWCWCRLPWARASRSACRR
jgi:lipopolysaccharide transport system permease protein